MVRGRAQNGAGETAIALGQGLVCLARRDLPAGFIPAGLAGKDPRGQAQYLSVQGAPHGEPRVPWTRS